MLKGAQKSLGPMYRQPTTSILAGFSHYFPADDTDVQIPDFSVVPRKEEQDRAKKAVGQETMLHILHVSLRGFFRPFLTEKQNRATGHTGAGCCPLARIAREGATRCDES